MDYRDNGIYTEKCINMVVKDQKYLDHMKRYKIDNNECNVTVKLFDKTTNVKSLFDKINKAVDDNICPNFLKYYYIDNKMAILETTSDNLHKLLIDLYEKYDGDCIDVINSISFQIVYGLLCMENVLKVNHSITIKNILYKSIDRNVVLKYTVNNINYYIPTYGYLVVLTDFDETTDENNNLDKIELVHRKMIEYYFKRNNLNTVDKLLNMIPSEKKEIPVSDKYKIVLKNMLDKKLIEYKSILDNKMNKIVSHLKEISKIIFNKKMNTYEKILYFAMFKKEIKYNISFKLDINNKIPILTIPSGTLLFRVTRDPYFDLAGVKNKEGYCLPKNMNIFFYSSPFIVNGIPEWFESFDNVVAYVTTKNIDVLSMIRNSIYDRGMRIHSTYATNCENIKSCLIGRPYDLCFTDLFFEEYSNVLGYIALARSDSDKFMSKYKSMNDDMKKYVLLEKDKRGVRGPPEISLYPLEKRQEDIIHNDPDNFIKTNNYNIKMISILKRNDSSILDFMNKFALYDKTTNMFQYIDNDKQVNKGGNINRLERISSDIIKMYFPNRQNVNFNDIQITTEGSYSVTSNVGSEKMINLIKKIMKTTDLTITDGTANVGSDSIKLGLVFRKVNSIELDKINFAALKNNVETYKLQNISLYNGDSLNIIPTLTQDVIYIDAPWGGKKYKDHKTIQLYLANKELSDVFNMFKHNTKLFVFKLPSNYDFTNFFEKTKVNEYNIFSHIGKGNIKFFLMIIKC